MELLSCASQIAAEAARAAGDEEEVQRLDAEAATPLAAGACRSRRGVARNFGNRP
jgi:hypothetical protein